MADAPTLNLSPEDVCFLVIKAREFDAKDVVTDPDPGSDGVDDGMRAVLEDHADDPVVQEIASFIASLNVDQQIDLVTLAWLGRGDGDVGNWDELREEAERAHNGRTAHYLLGMPLLSDYLEEGLSQLGYSCEDVEMGRL